MHKLLCYTRLLIRPDAYAYLFAVYGIVVNSGMSRYSRWTPIICTGEGLVEDAVPGFASLDSCG